MLYLGELKRWGLGYCIYNGIDMRNLEYKIKTIRMSEETWENLKNKRKKSKLSWNLFLVKLMKEEKKNV